jgi:hypothetical protein
MTVSACSEQWEVLSTNFSSALKSYVQIHEVPLLNVTSRSTNSGSEKNMNLEVSSINFVELFKDAQKSIFILSYEVVG